MRSKPNYFKVVFLLQLLLLLALFLWFLLLEHFILGFGVVNKSSSEALKVSSAFVWGGVNKAIFMSNPPTVEVELDCC